MCKKDGCGIARVVHGSDTDCVLFLGLWLKSGRGDFQFHRFRSSYPTELAYHERKVRS